MSSHREAPEISKDPVADNADVYAFVSPNPGEAGTVTIISNFVPLQGPAGGPNFYEFGDDVLYSIYIDNDGDAEPDIEYQFRFTSSLQNPNTFLYNTGQVTALDDPDWNARQVYSVTRIDAGHKPKGLKDAHDIDPGPAFAHGPRFASILGDILPCPPCNIGPRSTPDYETNLGSKAVQTLDSGEKVFCGQRNDPFYVDLGSIFDLAGLRPFNPNHLIPLTAGTGVDATKALNIHTIAIQVPITKLTKDGLTPADVTSSNAVLGIWSGASRRKVRMFDDHKNTTVESGPWVQVSRLGNPLFNEVIVPLGQKDEWNRENPDGDVEYLPKVQHPEVAGLIPFLYPGVFPNLDALSTQNAPRADLVAILLTGIPGGIISGFQNYTGPTYADMLRLNVAIPPNVAATPSKFGILGGDLAGFPNGRRIQDDVVTIELRAIAGVTYPLIDPKYKVDNVAKILTDGLTGASVTNKPLTRFPYMGVPYDGYNNPS
jgi:hypothetical protein